MTSVGVAKVVIEADGTGLPADIEDKLKAAMGRAVAQAGQAVAKIEQAFSRLDLSGVEQEFAKIGQQAQAAATAAVAAASRIESAFAGISITPPAGLAGLGAQFAGAEADARAAASGVEAAFAGVTIPPINGLSQITSQLAGAEADARNAATQIQTALNSITVGQLSGISGAVTDMRSLADEANRVATALSSLPSGGSLLSGFNPATLAADMGQLQSALNGLNANGLSQVASEAAQATTHLNTARAAADRLGTALAGIQNPTINVAGALADIARLEAAIRGLPNAAANININMNGQGGDAADGFLAGFGKVKGGIVGIIGGIALGGVGKQLADSLIGGMQFEASEDLLRAQLGIDESTAGKLGDAAGAAFAQNFGGSVEENLGTVKAAIQNGLLDPQATQAQAEQMISSLTAVATVMEDDVANAARAAGVAIKTGLVDDAGEAMDFFTVATQKGLNTSGEFLDTITEYSTHFAQLGLSAEEAGGLLVQAMDGGARSVDLAGDALKEFTIRGQDMSKASREAYQTLGIDADDAFRKVAKGGDGAKEVLGKVIDGLRGIEDPAQRGALAVALFGTQAEDLAGAFGSLDLSTAAAEFGGIEGAAQRAIAAMTSNDLNSVQTAFRGIQTAISEVQVVLAGLAGPAISEWANEVSANRTNIISAFRDITTFAIDAGAALLDFGAAAADGFASALDSIGGLVSGLGAAGEGVAGFLDLIPFAGDVADGFRDAGESAQELGQRIAGSSDSVREVGDQMREAAGKVREFGEGVNEAFNTPINNAAFGDAVRAANNAVLEFGEALATADIGAFNGKLESLGPAGESVGAALQGVNDEMITIAQTGANAGESVEEIGRNLGNVRQQAIDSAIALGLPAEAAEQLVDSMVKIPDEKTIRMMMENAGGVISDLDAIRGGIEGVAKGAFVTIHADGAQRAITTLQEVTDAVVEIDRTTGQIRITNPTPEVLQQVRDLGIELRQVADNDYRIVTTADFTDVDNQLRGRIEQRPVLPFTARLETGDLDTAVGNIAGLKLEGPTVPFNPEMDAVRDAVNMINGLNPSTDVRFNPQTGEVDSARNRISQPSDSSHFFRPDTGDVDSAKSRIQQPSTSVHKILGDASAAQAAINSLVNQNTTSTHTIFVREQRVGSSIGLAGAGLADGGIVEFYGDGGIRDGIRRVESYANGGTNENRFAQIVPAGTYRVFGETETDGEGYIPFAQSKRERSLDIFGEIGDRFGVWAGLRDEIRQVITQMASAGGGGGGGGVTRSVHAPIIVQGAINPQATANAIGSKLTSLMG